MTTKEWIKERVDAIKEAVKGSDDKDAAVESHIDAHELSDDEKEDIRKQTGGKGPEAVLSKKMDKLRSRVK